MCENAVVSPEKRYTKLRGIGEGNLIFCCTGSRKNYFGSVGMSKNTDHRVKET